MNSGVATRMSFSWSHGWLRAWRLTVWCVCVRVMSSPYISDLPPTHTSGENTSRGANSPTSRPEPRLNGFLTVLVLNMTHVKWTSSSAQSRTLCIGSKHAPIYLISRIRFRPLAGAPRSVSSDCNLVGFRAGDFEKEKLVEEVSRFSGGRTLHQRWTDCGNSFPSLVSSTRQSEVFLPTNDAMSVQHTTLVNVSNHQHRYWV